MENRKPVAQFTNSRYPYQRIRDLKFNAGLLVVYSEADAKLVRSISDFGVCIDEVPLVEHAHVQPRSDGGARQGTQTTAAVNSKEPPKTDEAQEDTSVLVLGGGWYQYQGKKYRKSQLQEIADGLV